MPNIWIIELIYCLKNCFQLLHFLKKLITQKKLNLIFAEFSQNLFTLTSIIRHSKIQTAANLLHDLLKRQFFYAKNICFKFTKLLAI